jgi:hypothetical protein
MHILLTERSCLVHYFGIYRYSKDLYTIEKRLVLDIKVVDDELIVA